MRLPIPQQRAVLGDNHGMKTETLTFVGSGGDRLVARLDTPDAPKAYALFAHCFTCNKNLRAVSNINRAMNQHEIAVLRFDFTGLGESEGDFADTNFSSNIDDLVRAAEFLAADYEPPKILVGHSLGGAAVLHAARRLASVQAVATIGAPAEPAHVKHLFASSQAEIEAAGEARVVLAGREFTIRRQFVEDLERKSMENCLAELRRALLVFHSPIDQTVGIENAAQIFTAAKHPKSFISLDKADHLLTKSADSRYVGAMVATWAAKYI